MRKMICVTTAILALGTAAVAHADDFGGQPDSQGYTASVKQQAADAAMADPTASNSLRSHGRP